MDADYRLDLLVMNTVVIEVEAVEEVLPIHTAQLLASMRLGVRQTGLLLVFNVPIMNKAFVGLSLNAAENGHSARPRLARCVSAAKS